MSKVLSALYRPSFGLHLLRIVVPVLMLMHGVPKLLGGIGWLEGMLSGMGLPGFLAYGVLLGEVVAPLFVLANRFVAPAALVMAFNMVVAVLMMHSAEVFNLGKNGGWALELQGFYFFTSLAIALTHKK